MLVCAGRLSRGGPTNRGLLSLGLRGLGNLSRSGRRSGRAHRRCPCGRDCHLAALEHPDDMARRVHRIRPQGQDLKAPGGGRLSAIGGTPTKGQPTRKCFRGARPTVVSSSRRGNSLPSHRFAASWDGNFSDDSEMVGRPQASRGLGGGTYESRPRCLDSGRHCEDQVDADRSGRCRIE